MKILSIWQPWAHLIAHGSKNIENRSWQTKYRGPILVHASSNIDREACRERGVDAAKLQAGGGVGIAEITDCVEDHRSNGLRGRTVLYCGIVNLCRLCFGKVLWDCVMRPSDY